jgi:hypothetical protein
MRYKIELEVESYDRDEENIALYAEGVLANHFDVLDMKVRPL